MSVLSDRDIRRMCISPTHVRYNGWGKKEFLSAPFSEHEEGIIRNTERHSQPNQQIPVPKDMDFIRPITEKELSSWKPMIAPYESKSVKVAEYKALGDEDGERSRRKIISHGSSSYGYDVKLSDDVRLFTDINCSMLDPKKFDKNAYVKAKKHHDDDDAEYVIMPPHSFILGVTTEYFHIPRDLLVLAVGKSTYARIGLIVNVTPLEPEWEGNVVVEISNTTSLPAKVYIDEGVAQFLFLKANSVCEVSYADRGGKYQGQTGITPAKV